MPFHRTATCPFSLWKVAISVLIPWMAKTPVAYSAPSSSAVLSAQSLQVLAISDIKNEPALRAKVSFTAKNELLRDLLFDLQKQSHITLSIGEGAPASSVKVTAYVQNLALSQVILGLSRVYGVRWAKTNATTFTMLPTDRNTLELGLMQLGDMDKARGRFITELRSRSEDTNWPPQILKYVEEKSLLNGAAPLISTLPSELLSRIRREKEDQAALQIVDSQQRAMEASIDDYILSVEAPNTTMVGGKPLTVPARVVVRRSDGQSITLLARPSDPSNETTTLNNPVPQNGRGVPNGAT